MMLAVWAGRVPAQSITHGDLSGTVKDSAGAPIEGALVTLADQLAGGRQIASVGADGRFSFPLLAPGRYQVRAEQIGYRPVVLRNIQVEPGTAPSVVVTLSLDSLPVARIDTVYWSGPSLASEPGASEGLPAGLLQRFPSPRYDLTSFRDFTTVAGDDWGLQGLPGAATGVVVDGLPYDVARSRWLPLSDRFGPALSAPAFTETAAQLAPLDADWGDFPGGVASVVTRRGARDLTAQAFGGWAPAALTHSRFFDAGTLAPQSYLGGLTVAGPILPDTANFLIGGQAGQFEVVRPAAWPALGADSAIASVALDSAGQSLGGYLAPRVVRETQASGFGRFSWVLSPGQTLDVWASGGRFTRQEPDVGPLAAPSLGSRAEGTDLAAGGSITSRLGERSANELRAGFFSSRRDYSAGPLPATFFADGQAAGTDPTLPGKFQLTTVRLRDDFHTDAGAHRLKLELAGALNSYNQTSTPGGGFYFTDAAALGAQRGAYLGVTGPQPNAQFSVPSLGAFLQDSWEVAPGLAFLVAVRYDLEFLPRSSVPRNQAWLNLTGVPNDSILTGLANDSIPRSIGKWSSRLGFDWRAGERQDWHVRGGVGIYHGQVDPDLLAELITQAGQNEVHRGVGALGAWPAVPDPANAPEAGALLTLLGPQFQPPRSSKASLGIGRRLGRYGVFEVALDLRHTDFLPRRHDLNRPLGRSSADQYGRPIYSPLLKEGGIVAPGSSLTRRFDGFELVSAMDPDGYSNYVGVTVRLVQPMSRFLRAYAGYTYSHTADNWLTGLHGGPYAQLSPFPDSLNGQDWADGTSDLDIPHRVAVGAELRPAGTDAVTLALRYRWQSGAPFTPGLAPGVDANGDGSFSNDPAYVDDALPGMTDLLAAWSCLRPQVGRFAERNSCRDPGIGTLDLRLGVAPARQYPVELWVEGFNLTEPAQGLRDHALYGVDPATPLTVNGSTGRTTIPYVANANFGQQLSLRTPGRVVRVGLRVNY